MRRDQYGGHVSRWPPPWQRDRKRRPAVLQQHEGSWLLVDEDGESWQVASHDEVLSVADAPYSEEAKRERLDAYVPKIGHYPYLSQALENVGKGTTAYASAHGASGLACRYKRATIRIGESEPWGYEKADGEFLADLAATFRHLGVGAQVTPGALGHATMVRKYLDAGTKRQSRPNFALRKALLENRVGARSDPPISSERFARIYELDLHDAYCWAASQDLPCGPVERFLDGDVKLPETDNRSNKSNGVAMESDRGDDDRGRNRDVERHSIAHREHHRHAIKAPTYATWYARCSIYTPVTLRNSPVCTRDGVGHVRPLRAKGHHVAWIWREEAEAMVKTGAVVIVHEGWGWLEKSPILRPWALWIHEKRATAPTEAVANIVKLCITAGIGRHGMAPETRRLVLAKDAPDDSPLLEGYPTAHPLCVVTERDHDANWLTHVHDYIVMRVRLWQYERMVEEDNDGNTIVASNTDAIYVLAPSRRVLDPMGLGGVRQRERLNWRSPYPRAAVWDGGERLPGLHGKEREVFR